MRNRLTAMAVALLLALVLAACGGGDDEATDTAAGDAAPSSDDSSDADDAEADDAAASAGGGGSGELVLGDETIVFDSARCFLQEQDAAAGGGKILFVGQGFGTNAAGDELIFDVSRYDEDSQFTGDDILVDIGDFETGVSWKAGADLGTVDVNGNTLSADGLTFVNWDDFSELTGSFVLNC